MRRLNKKEILFCHQYLKTGDEKEAAILSGYTSSPEKVGMELLSREEICKEIDRLYSEKKKKLTHQAIIGYERLAFGNISDIIKLIFTENMSFEEIRKMNLFNIAEIKKPRDGALEIKFFDRLRALEKLEQIDSHEDMKQKSFYQALEDSIQKFCGGSSNQIEEEKTVGI
ncbi:MAG: terminase small subunit [Acutalibacteraceae bacterium]